MIGYLKGTLAEVNQDSCEVDIGGVGYVVHCSSGTLADLKEILDRDDRSVKLYTKLIHREDVLSLYGFLHREEQRLFDMLITVSGIGPRQALKIIGTGSTAHIVRAVVSGDDGFLRSLSGIGEKKARQIIFELREKLKKSFGEYDKEIPADYTEAISALESLGFSRSEAHNAIKHVLETMQGKRGTADIVEASLRFLSG
jgi:Holliday junction DNA helicase RuvA